MNKTQFNKAVALKESIEYIDKKLDKLRLERKSILDPDKAISISFLYTPGGRSISIDRYQGDQPELNAIVERVEAVAIKELKAIKEEYQSEFEKL